MLLASGPSVAQNAQPGAAATAEALAALLQKDASGFASTNAPWQFTFPRDHGAHPDHRTESWQVSGSLVSREGRRFGFQLAFFRIGVTPPATPIGPSAWATRDVYWAQFTLGDAAANRAYQFERVERAAMGLSGSEASPARVWVGDWIVEMRDARKDSATFSLRAANADVRIALSLRSAKPPVIPAMGDGRRASSNAPNTFYAYLMTRLLATGTVHIANQVFEVDGHAWLDRAWGLVPLPVGAVVWDRFLLQLDEGSELMALRFRRRDGSGEPIVTGILVARDGSMRTLAEGALDIDLIDRATDPGEGTPVSARWRLRVPGEQIELRLTPHVTAQGTRLSLRSWAGAIGIRGTARGQAIEGQGYVELAADSETVRRR